MKSTQVNFEILQPAINHDPLKTRKVIVTIELDFEATAERSLNAIRKKGAVYRVGLIVLPRIGDELNLEAVTGELTYEAWSRKRLVEFARLRLDTREGIVITADAYQHLADILSRKVAVPLEEKKEEAQPPTDTADRKPLHIPNYNGFLL